MVQNFIQNMLAKQEQPKPLDIKFMQFNEKGEFDPVLTAERGLQIQQDTTPLTLKDRLFGREMTQDYQIISPDNKNVEMATAVNYKPGLLEDLTSGFKENYTQGFNVNNLVPQNKGLATKIGEGLGTLARFYDKPIGRMAVATGLSALTGNVNPMNEGITAYVGRQNNLTQDSVYRNQLKQMGMSEEDVNAIPGIVNSDIFKTIASAMRYNNQRVTWGQLAQISPEIAQMIEQNPELENTFIPVNLARDIYGLKRETAQGKMAETNAKTAGIKAKTKETEAKTDKTKAETKQVGKPKVNINIKQGGTTSRIIHEGGSPKPTKPERPTRTTGGGRARVGNQQYTQEEIRKELIKRRLINAYN